MITNNSFDYAQYYKKTIDSILLKENAFKPLDEAMNYIINHSTDYQSMIKSYSYNKTDKFVIVLDANSNEMLIGNYTNNCVALKIDYTKKNTKLNKLFGKIIRSEAAWKNTRDEFIKLIISYFDKQYKEIYEKTLHNVILDSNQYDYFPFPCKDVQEILNQLKKPQIRKTDVNRNLLNYFISYFITDQSNYDYLLSFLNNYDLLEIYFTFNWVQFLYSQDRQTMPSKLKQTFMYKIKDKIKEDVIKSNITDINDLLTHLKNDDHKILISFIKKELKKNGFDLLYDFSEYSLKWEKRFIGHSEQIYSKNELLKLTTINQKITIYGTKKSNDCFKEQLGIYKILGSINPKCTINFVDINISIPYGYKHYILMYS